MAGTVEAPHTASAPVKPPSDPLLSVFGLTLRFGGVTALNDVSFDVQPGELFAVIGPNGAGKTSIFNCLNAVYRPQQGRILLDGADLLGLGASAGRRSLFASLSALGGFAAGPLGPRPRLSARPLKPRRTAELGIARTFQNLGLFENLNVIDNLMLGRHHLMRTGFVAGALWFGKARREEVVQRRKVEEIIELLELEPYRYQPAGMMPYGVQKRIELGRALAMEPRLLLLDEPVAGMNLEETENTARYILEIKAELDLAMILVEHDMHMVMDIADRVMVLDFGRVIATGAPADIQTDPKVIEAYLGGA